MPGKISCPKCGQAISVDEAIVQRMVDLKVRKTLADEKDRLEKDLKENLAREQADYLKSVQARVDEARAKELLSLKKQAELEDKLKVQELELARQMQAEKLRIAEQASKEAGELWEMRLREKEKQLEDQKKLIAEMQRKAHQASMQTQGEVLELSLEEILKKHFPHDKIEPVPKGMAGADIIQTVYGDSYRAAGKIAWEAKRTKNWTEDWIQKLKDDSRAIQADIAVLVTEVMPRDLASFGQYKGIWIGNFSQIPGIAAALRCQLMAVSSAMTAETDKGEKMESIYKYVCSATFIHKVQALVETHDHMRLALENEKRSMIKNWSVRETQIIRLTENTAKLYGELKGRLGGALPTIELLELEAPARDKEDKTQSTLL